MDKKRWQDVNILLALSLKQSLNLELYCKASRRIILKIRIFTGSFFVERVALREALIMIPLFKEY